jgi:PEP-CTERM motif
LSKQILNRTPTLCGAFILLSLASPSWASTNFVTNGSFESTTAGGGQLGFNTNATDWTNLPDGAGDPGYNFLFTPGSADTTGETGDFGDLQLWGPGNGSANGLPATSPDGGNYIAADGAFEIGAIQQTIAGNLTIGATYALSFWWAGAQQSGFTGPNTEQWQVSLGDLTQSTAIVDNTSQGFTGWQLQTFDFVADQVNPVLSFLAVGTPNGEPPFSLLDGVDLEAVPEPATFALIGLGLMAIPLAGRLRRRRG